MNKKRLMLGLVPIANVVFWYIFTMKNSHKMAKGWQIKIVLCMLVSGIVGSVFLLAVKSVMDNKIGQSLLLNYVLEYLFSLIIVVPQILLHDSLLKKE